MQLMRVYGEIAVNIDPDLAYQRALGSYAATAGRSERSHQSPPSELTYVHASLRS